MESIQTHAALQFLMLQLTHQLSMTLVNFIAYPEALNCENEPEYCIGGDTIVFEIPIEYERYQMIIIILFLIILFYTKIIQIHSTFHFEIRFA